MLCNLCKVLKTVESDEFGVKGINGVAMVGSRMVAEVFGKRHDHLLRDISNIEQEMGNVAPQFWVANFKKTTYNNRGKKYPEYLLTKDGFAYVVMGFTGSKAAKFKVDYITRFNQMQDFINSRNDSKIGHKTLSNNLDETLGSSNKWVLPNEFDMINKIVLGKRAKAYRESRGITSKVTRDYLNAFEIYAIAELQKADNLLISLGFTEYYDRKDKLIQLFNDKIKPKELQYIA